MVSLISDGSATCVGSALAQPANIFPCAILPYWLGSFMRSETLILAQDRSDGLNTAVPVPDNGDIGTSGPASTGMHDRRPMGLTWCFAV